MVTPTQLAFGTLSQLVSPSGMATMVPMTMDSRMEIRASAGGANRSINTISSSVPAASATFSIGAPSAVTVGLPTQLAATPNSDSPMIRITVPVTSGGKNRTSWAKNGANRIMNRPQAITEP